MAQALPFVGAGLGFLIGGPAGAQWGWAIGSAVASSQQVIQGPRIGEIARQTSQEGVPRPIVYALSPPIAGNILATGEPRIVKRKEGGKGGPKVETESVYRTYAVGVSEGPIFGFVRVWRNGILVYDARLGATPENSKFLANARLFVGDYDQLPSPDLEAIFGVGTTPAHRGTAYMVMADEDLTDLRGSIPQWTFQVAENGVLDCEDVTEYSNESLTLWPSDSNNLIDPRALCAKYEYRWDRGGANGYSPPSAGDAGSLEAALLNATTSLGAPITIQSGLLGWNLRNDTAEGIYPYPSQITSSQFNFKRWFFFNQFDPAGLSNAQWNPFGQTFHSFASANNLNLKWWSGNNSSGSSSTHGVLFFTPPTSWNTHPDQPVEVRLVPRAPYTQCDECGDGLLPSGIPGYCTDGNGNYYSSDPWILHSTTYKVLQKTALNTVSNLYTKLPLNPALPSSHVDYNNQSFWEAAYADAVTAGDMAAGLTYNVHYPQTQSYGYIRSYESCELIAGSIPLADLVSDLCDRVGLTQIDVSQLEGDVRGFMVTNGYPAYEALRALSEVFLFDPSNYDGVLHFIPRGGSSVATITEDDMVDDDTEVEQRKRSDAISIPRVLHLNYHDVDGGLNTDKQSSERAGDRRSVGESSLQTTVILSANEAARAVDINHKVLIEDQKGEVKLSLPDNFLKLVVADPIIVQQSGNSERCRIIQVDTQDGYQAYTFLRDRQSAYTSNVEGIPAAPQTPTPSGVVGPTLIEPLDIHVLRDADDSVGLGYYVAISGLLDAWQGATIELSLDSGANYIDSASWTVSATMGETTTVLSDHPQAYPDEVNTVGVRIDTPDAELLETDLTGLLNRQNFAIIGDEIIQFANADETTAGEWELSYLLRGRKGTETAEHAIGTRFVLLDRASIPFIPAELTELNRTLTFRATSFGATTDTGTVVSMTFTGKSQTERAPAYLQARLDGSDVVLSWQGVGRLGAGAQSAHGAYFLGYRVTITDGSLTQTYDTSEQSLTQDVSAFTGALTISVQQRNHFTGLGPSIEVIV